MIYKEFEWRDVVKRSLYAVFMIIPMQFLRYLLWEITHKDLYFSDFWKEAINGSGFSDLFTLLGICFATSFLISTTSLSSLPEFFLIRICFVIMKKKRYKVMPLICLIMFICFIGCGIVSILSLTLPYGEILVYPLGAIIFGLVFILVGVNDLYSLLRCREKVDGVYCGYNTYYGGNGISTQSPIFEYTYNGTYYREQTAQNISHKRLNRSMTRGNVYSIYIDPKHPAVFILAKKIKIGTIVSIILGLFIFTYGIDLLLKFLPMLLSR